MLHLELRQLSWPYREPFAISRGTKLVQNTIVVSLTDEAGRRGQGEACGVTYAGETVPQLAAQLEAKRAAIEAGITRQDLLQLLPAGGARCALDAALWDLEAKQSGISAFARAGIALPNPIHTAITIGIRSLAAYEVAGRTNAAYRTLKIKVNGDDPLPAIAAVRRGAPTSRFIVDPNQAWSPSQLKQLAPQLVELGVALLEQPIPVGAEAELDGYRSPIPLCADELINDVADLDRAVGRFDVVNIKLDKAGGLTNGLRLAEAAHARGFALMVGCMGGSSLAMAPGLVLAQQCAFVDLDGPLLHSDDCADALVYSDGEVGLPSPRLWG